VSTPDDLHGDYPTIEKSRCVFCREPIRTDAVICSQCKNYQDCRKYFTLSSTVLSLLVALFSVLTVAVPVLKNALTPQRSAIHCSLLHWTSEGVSLIVSNRGTRPATAKALKLMARDTTTKATSLQFKPTFTDPILEPGKSRVLDFRGSVSDIFTDIPPIQNFRATYRLNLIIFPFSSERGNIDVGNWNNFDE
jgi:predicted nucleic acid-binding Zn ribbon protein